MTTPKTCDEMRELIGNFLQTADSSEAQRLWDIITCQRGPDSPSERPDMTEAESATAYRLRRERKRATVEVIRKQAFGGVVGGAARWRDDIKYVTLPPQNEWDHFDRHVEKAARAMGLEVKIQEKEEEKEKKNEVVVELKSPLKTTPGTKTLPANGGIASKTPTIQGKLPLAKDLNKYKEYLAVYGHMLDMLNKKENLSPIEELQQHDAKFKIKYYTELVEDKLKQIETLKAALPEEAKKNQQATAELVNMAQLEAVLGEANQECAPIGPAKVYVIDSVPIAAHKQVSLSPWESVWDQWVDKHAPKEE